MSDHTLKRKVDDLDDSDEEPMLGRQVLPVANLPDTFDGVPMDGMQYLFTVRRNARLLPRTTRVANPYEPPEVPYPPPAQAPGLEADPRCKNILPSEEWRETFLRRFKNFRKNSVQPTIHVHIPDTSTKLVPDKKERDLWWAFLAGRPESEWNPPKKPKQPKLSRWQQRTVHNVRGGMPEDVSLPYDVGESSYVVPESTSSPAPSGEVLPSDLNNSATSSSQHPAAHQSSDLSQESRDALLSCLPREPTPTLFQQMDHKYAMHLLMYFGHWINVRLEEGSLPHTDLKQSHARWIFTLLSRVDDWLSGDETSLLRTLARGCMGLIVEQRRRRLAGREVAGGETVEGSTDIDERSCWMIITAIAGLWGQSDLWMDAESMLSQVEREPV
ncbi:hypothetical protein C8Q80DRAFT_1157788 [Daedaleopsis nitida]|nr:hypothetical protein C8Q80DRAFT_1157788 [Daedaleopsis nitida]